MKPRQNSLMALLILLAAFISYGAESKHRAQRTNGDRGQVPNWSRKELEFFVHGSMSTEFVPEDVLRALIQTYPDMFPAKDLSNVGLIPDPVFGWPLGFSRSRVPHLGGVSAVGINCAACHLGDVTSGEGEPVRVLGMTSLFDAEGFFGAVIVAGFQTAVPANMKKFMSAYLATTDPKHVETAQATLENEWRRQEQQIVRQLSTDPQGTHGAKATGFQDLRTSDLQLNEKLLKQGVDLSAKAHVFLKLFHNMRAALHVPDQPPDKVPPASGPGRNDAFGLLSAVLFGAPQPYAPVKYGLVWNLKHRHWVHWDGNTQSPIGRNLLASLGLGAPLLGHKSQLDFALVKRQTDLSEGILPPRYPFAVDRAKANLGAPRYQQLCASCHDGPESDARLYTAKEIGTDPQRAELFTQAQAERFDKFLAELETAGYQPPKEPGIRSTQKYWAASLAGVWARSPYLHNGSVRTMYDLLSPAERAKIFRRGSRMFDEKDLGYRNEGSYVLDTSKPGNSNSGHEYGAKLSEEQKRELIEYVKTL